MGSDLYKSTAVGYKESPTGGYLGEDSPPQGCDNMARAFVPWDLGQLNLNITVNRGLRSTVTSLRLIPRECSYSYLHLHIQKNLLWHCHCASWPVWLLRTVDIGNEWARAADKLFARLCCLPFLPDSSTEVQGRPPPSFVFLKYPQQTDMTSCTLSPFRKQNPRWERMNL